MTMTVRYTTVGGEVIAEKNNGVRRLYVPDPLGSTVALLDNMQTQVDTFTYWPYGEVRTNTGTTPPSFQFGGTLGYYTDAPGRTYVRARYLHTHKGRWLTQDPIGFGGGDWNLYRYVNASPVSNSDPSGMSCPLRPPGACFWCHYQHAINVGYTPKDACGVAKKLCKGSSIDCNSPSFCVSPAKTCVECDDDYQSCCDDCGDIKDKKKKEACYRACSDAYAKCRKNCTGPRGTIKIHYATA